MINIPYFKYQNSDGTYSKLPIIPVRLACNKNHQWVYALLDSGADMSLFNASIAKLLNVTVKDGDPISVYGVMDFAQSTAYLHQVNLSVAGLRSVDTNVAFSDDEVYPQLAILGRRDSSKSFGSSLTVMNE